MRKINVYDCCVGHETVTVEYVEGTTPMMLHCKTAGCHHTAVSRGYSEPFLDKTPEWEWYRPSEKEVVAMSLSMQDHIKMGGLDLRKIIYQ